MGGLFPSVPCWGPSGLAVPRPWVLLGGPVSPPPWVALSSLSPGGGPVPSCRVLALHPLCPSYQLGLLRLLSNFLLGPKQRTQDLRRRRSHQEKLGGGMERGESISEAKQNRDTRRRGGDGSGEGAAGSRARSAGRMDRRRATCLKGKEGSRGRVKGKWKETRGRTRNPGLSRRRDQAGGGLGFVIGRKGRGL